MNCENCNNKMEIVYTYRRGRHVRAKHKCSCGNIKDKNIDTIPNKDVMSGFPVRKPYVPWGKAKHIKVNPKKKRRKK